MCSRVPGSTGCPAAEGSASRLARGRRGRRAWCHACFVIFVSCCADSSYKILLSKISKSHERRIHGHRHAGIRIVLEGPTLVHALDAHVAHPEPFSAEDLLPYRTAREPPCQQEALNRRKIMRKARSKKNRPILLADLERRYREIANS